MTSRCVVKSVGVYSEHVCFHCTRMNFAGKGIFFVRAIIYQCFCAATKFIAALFEIREISLEKLHQFKVCLIFDNQQQSAFCAKQANPFPPMYWWPTLMLVRSQSNFRFWIFPFCLWFQLNTCVNLGIVLVANYLSICESLLSGCVMPVSQTALCCNVEYPKTFKLKACFHHIITFPMIDWWPWPLHSLELGNSDNFYWKLKANIFWYHVVSCLQLNHPLQEKLCSNAYVNHVGSRRQFSSVEDSNNAMTVNTSNGVNSTATWQVVKICKNCALKICHRFDRREFFITVFCVDESIAKLQELPLLKILYYTAWNTMFVCPSTHP